METLVKEFNTFFEAILTRKTEQSRAKAPILSIFLTGLARILTIAHPILLHLNEMKCSRSPLYNETKLTSISVQI